MVLLIHVFLIGCTAGGSKGEADAIVYDRFSRYEQADGDHQYMTLLARSAARDEAAIRLFLSSKKQYDYDGAAAEGHAEVLGFLLRHTGDAFFGRALNGCDTNAQKYVRGSLIFDMAHFWDEKNAKNAEAILRYEYPITFAEE